MTTSQVLPHSGLLSSVYKHIRLPGNKGWKIKKVDRQGTMRNVYVTLVATETKETKVIVLEYMDIKELPAN